MENGAETKKEKGEIKLPENRNTQVQKGLAKLAKSAPVCSKENGLKPK